ERWHDALMLVELLVDDLLEPRDEALRKMRQRRGRGGHLVRAGRAVETLEDAVIHRSLVAMIDLQLALGMLDVLHAEDVLQPKLLRTLAEVLELGGGEGALETDAGDVAVEDGAGAAFAEELEGTQVKRRPRPAAGGRSGRRSTHTPHETLCPDYLPKPIT